MLLYKFARGLRGIVRPFLSAEIRHRINLALIRRANGDGSNSAQIERTNNFGVNIFGYVHAESGIGQSARSTILSLSAAEVPVSL